VFEYFKRLLTSPVGRVTGIVVSLAALGFAACSVASFFRGGTPESVRSRMYICTETRKQFRHVNQMGETLPIFSSFSGKNTGMPAEACYWTADGKAKKEPTWVLLKEYVNEAGPTFCPDCGRLVVGHNPAPGPGVRVPPTAQQYVARNLNPE
jgi:hypothetical protein